MSVSMKKSGKALVGYHSLLEKDDPSPLERATAGVKLRTM
jgi:hypothetical protein